MEENRQPAAPHHAQPLDHEHGFPGRRGVLHGQGADVPEPGDHQHRVGQQEGAARARPTAFGASSPIEKGGGSGPATVELAAHHTPWPPARGRISRNPPSPSREARQRSLRRPRCPASTAVLTPASPAVRTGPGRPDPAAVPSAIPVGLALLAKAIGALLGVGHPNTSDMAALLTAQTSASGSRRACFMTAWKTRQPVARYQEPGPPPSACRPGPPGWPAQKRGPAGRRWGRRSGPAWKNDTGGIRLVSDPAPAVGPRLTYELRSSTAATRSHERLVISHPRPAPIRSQQQ